MPGSSAALRCGVDLVDIAAFGRALSVGGERMTGICFTDREMADSKGRIASLAARWAGKEAVAKALGLGFMTELAFQDVEIMVNRLGAPRVRLQGAARHAALREGLSDWALSLSHEGNLAVAFVVATSE